MKWGLGSDRAESRRESSEGWFPWLLVIALMLMIGKVLWEVFADGGGFNISKLAQKLVSELAVAVFIAWVISVGIERLARSRDARLSETRRQAIAENVVQGVFGVQYPSRYVQAVIDAHLTPRVVRTHYNAAYVIRHLTAAECSKLGVTEARFVAFLATRSFKFKNVSSRSTDFEVKASIPLRRALKLREFARMKAVTFDGRRLSNSEVQDAVMPIADVDEHRTYRWTHSIDAGKELGVVFESIMVKELSDTELWWNAHPTLEGARFSVSMPAGMNFDLQAVTSNDLIKESVSEEDGTGTWNIDGPVLPNESVMFWWRTPEDDGVAEGVGTV
jgi:hypothetical protein